MTNNIKENQMNDMPNEVHLAVKKCIKHLIRKTA
uniref:Uncharacterized protein n=1 Tax=viral metagenome TaxID=1070528 RepID=A0A6C0I693_9ZZZZ